MLYLFHGEDTIRSLNKLNELIQNLLKKRGAADSLFEINDENFDESYFKNLTRTNHLFGEKNLVVLKRVFENKNLSDYFAKNITHISESPNIFIFWEESPDKEIMDAFQKEAKKIWQFKKSQKEEQEKQRAEKEEGRRLFQITDAFSERKPRLAWLLLQKAAMNGINEEEIFWKIFWQLKNLIILKNYQGLPAAAIAKKAKMHPFVLQKNLRALSLFKKEELEALAKNLLDIYQAHRYNKVELSFGMEKMILGL